MVNYDRQATEGVMIAPSRTPMTRATTAIYLAIHQVKKHPDGSQVVKQLLDAMTLWAMVPMTSQFLEWC